MWNECVQCGTEFSSKRSRLTCSMKCKNARSRKIHKPVMVERQCVLCKKTFPSSGRVTCSYECHRGVATLARTGKRVELDLLTCDNCGKQWRSLSIYRKKTCSKECRRALNKKKRQDKAGPAIQCKVCGRPCPTPNRVTCSKDCAAKARATLAKKNTSWHNQICTYSPPNGFDRENMIEILTRKGYTEGQAKERYQWEETQEGDILFRDLPPKDLSPRDAVYNREACSRKELPPNRNGVEQAHEKKGAYKSPLEKFLSCIEGGPASAQETMG